MVYTVVGVGRGERDFDEKVLDKIEELHNSKELVFFADSEYLVQKAMQLQFSYLKRKDIVLEMFANGQDLVQRLDNVLDSIKLDKLDGVLDIQPIKLIICDISMPIMDGY